jgi:hypothetical protein
MYHRSMIAFAQRTIVRDPRIKKVKKTKIPSSSDSSNSLAPQVDSNAQPSVFEAPQKAAAPPPLPFSPSNQNQLSVGSMVGSYMLAGFGMGLGVILVRVLLGV